MLLNELLRSVEEKRIARFRDVDVSGLAYDSRLLEPGQAFFCIKGLITDGHLFARDAVSKGASVLFVEKEPDDEVGRELPLVTVPDTRQALAACSARFYGEPSGEMKLVGVTGTNGKTTTAFLAESVLGESGLVTGLVGTVEKHIAGKVEPVTRTTPESLDLQRLLRRMVDSDVDVTVIEVSSHALELHRVDYCQFDVVVFTNLTQDHLDFHISLEEYFAAKRRLFEEGEFGRHRTALINIDDRFGRTLHEETSLPRISFGIDSRADIRATDVEVLPTGNRFNIRYEDREIAVRTRLQGRFNVYNCLAAAAVAIEQGIGPESIARGLEMLAGVPGRFENIDRGQPFTALVDYAHTPDGIRNLLEACRDVTEGRVIIVVGCGGDRDQSKRPLMGRVGTELSDLCVITSDNPRGEDQEAIIEMILEGIRGRFEPQRYKVEVDRRKAIALAVCEARPGDLLVIAGKGHESGQIFADRVIPFDDREVLGKCLMEVTGEER